MAKWAAPPLVSPQARIAIERRRFLDGSTAAVRRQALWASLAHDMTAEYRALCAEEAYLHQELEKLQEPRYQREGLIREGQNGSEISLEAQKSLSVSKASQLWDALMSHTAQHEKLASGPIEDLIAHREHRYRVSGPALRAAMDRSSNISANELLSSIESEDACATVQCDQKTLLGHEINGSSHARLDLAVSALEFNEEIRARGDERAAKGSSSIDVAEILRRWTHSLQRLHRQAVRLARSNDGAGPDLIKETSDDKDNGHAQALRATLTEHKQHLGNIQALIDQLKDSMPGMEASIASLREQVSRTTPLMVPPSSSISDRLVPLRDGFHGQGAEGLLAKSGAPQLELIPPSPALKLPQIFSSASIGRSPQLPKARVPVHRSRSMEVSGADNLGEQAPALDMPKADLEDGRDDNFALLRQSVHTAALSARRSTVEESKPEPLERNVEHFFTPIVSGSILAKENEGKKETITTSPEYHRYSDKSPREKLQQDRDEEQEQRRIEDIISPSQIRASKLASKCLSFNGVPKKGNAISDPEIHHTEASCESNQAEFTRPFSPPLLTELSSFSDTYDDLLGAEDFELSDVALEGVWFNPGM